MTQQVMVHKTSTLKEAFQTCETQPLNDVTQWFESNLETTEQVKGSNPVVAPCTYYEYQHKLTFPHILKIQKLEQCMLCIDTFTNYDVVVPVKSKIEDDIAAGILACMHKMGNKPEIIYTDHEGALHKPSIHT